MWKMGIIKDICRFSGEELDALLTLDKRVHHTLVYGITRMRKNGRKLVKKTSDLLIMISEED